VTTPTFIEIGKRIREAREGAGYKSAQSFSQALDVGYRTIQRWESGQITPSVEKLMRVGLLTGTSVDYLMTGRKEKAA
jgi:transcriptional regulator with XRE-family HTH domain